jgi:hypothetical protein
MDARSINGEGYVDSLRRHNWYIEQQTFQGHPMSTASFLPLALERVDNAKEELDF